MNNAPWTRSDLDDLVCSYRAIFATVTKLAFCKEWGGSHGRTGTATRLKLDSLFPRQVISDSPYPKYDTPLTMEGDALVLPDIEFPFHNANFLNRCLELAKLWDIRQCIVAGDVMHFDSLSGWEPNWTAPNTGGLTESAEAALMEFAESLPSKRQGEMMELLGDIGQREEQDGVSTEMGVARRELRKLADQFDKIDFVIGNHEGRLLRAMQTTLDPEELKRLLELGDKWRIAPYYFSYLISGGEKYCIDHPKSASPSTAAVLAAKFGCHVLMGHSHHFSITTDVSGKFFAAEIGCCVDEDRLPYAAQRHTRTAAHSLGAAIVQRGHPTILTKFTDWDKLLDR